MPSLVYHRTFYLAYTHTYATCHKSGDMLSSMWWVLIYFTKCYSDNACRNVAMAYVWVLDLLNTVIIK